MNFRTYSQSDNSCWGFLNQIPFGIKIILILLTAVTLINTLCSEKFTYWFEDLPSKVFEDFELWRLFFTQFINSYLSAMFMFFIFCTQVVDLEKKLGTVVFLLDFFFKNIMIQITFLILSLIVQIYSIPSRGLWNFYLVYISLQCYANPEQLIKILFLPCQLPGKYLPFVYALIGLAVNQNYDSIAALIFAYIEAKFFNSMMFRPSQSFIKKIENSHLMKGIRIREDFYLMTENLQSYPTKELPERDQEYQGRIFQGQGVQIGGNNINLENIVIDDSEQFEEDDTERNE
ncbi:unnamed protein product [Paramecium octaurelia]|uniref:Derlin n=1 Tax=Paramecium octaurelia TaxID=43137 RepID=A0A8S1XYZ4_PAROT|nr:unnamed protein product [Paramecium octaurelia]